MLNAPLKQPPGLAAATATNGAINPPGTLQTKAAHHKLLEKRSPNSAMTKSFGPAQNLVGSGLMTSAGDGLLQVPTFDRRHDL